MAAQIDINGKSFLVKELTVREVREWVKQDRKDTKPDVVGVLLFDDIWVDDMMYITGSTQEEIDGLTPTQLRGLADLCIKENHYFFALRSKVMSAGLTHITKTVGNGKDT